MVDACSTLSVVAALSGFRSRTRARLVFLRLVQLELSQLILSLPDTPSVSQRY